MMRSVPWIALGLAALYLLASLALPRDEAGFHAFRFGQLPVLEGGRIKPLESVARNSLVLLSGKQRLKVNGREIAARPWLLDVLFRADIADTLPVFVIHNSEILGLLHQQSRDQKYFSFQELLPFGADIEEQAAMAAKLESARRSPFQRDILNLRERLVLYHRLKNTIALEEDVDPFEDLQIYQHIIQPGLQAIHAHSAGENVNGNESIRQLLEFVSRYRALNELARFFALPPVDGVRGSAGWIDTGQALLERLRENETHPGLAPVLEMASAYKQGEVKRFNAALDVYSRYLLDTAPDEVGKARLESRFNQSAPFYRAMTLYVIVFLVSCAGWLGAAQLLNRTGFLLICLTFLVHTVGLVLRMYLEGRPPVTNLYSSAVFVGWSAVLLGIILEAVYRNGVGNLVSSVIGFTTLIIAHHLSLTGDTLELMRAVLDSNFWLSTHVVTITIGYSGTFLAGFLAIVFIVRGVFTRTLSADLARQLPKMVFGILCFAALFTFTGTVLGGIWADQSWGRFWGWDPKENGALLIVLWILTILHARLAGKIRGRGLMVMAVFGNVVTSWSWFGTNMLGIGLHSYGFMDAAFFWLLAFIVSQVMIMGIGTLPLERWRSSVAN